MSEIAVNVSGLSKRFRLYSNPWHRGMEWASFGRFQRHVDFWALRDVSFQVRRGQCLGIVGKNGAGKSTLLKIISRALYATQGGFEVNGRTVSLLELGTGFHPQLTGIQNIFNSARLLGFSEDYVRGRVDAIIEFSDLGEFIHRPVKIYSSGMYLRLAFSLFACLEPDVYIIDEALAIGDASFQKKCVDRMNQMRQSGVTILFVSHDLWRVEALCDTALYMEAGRIKAFDSPPLVIRRYLDDIEIRSERRAPGAGAMYGIGDTGSCPEPEAPPLSAQYEMYADSPLRVRRLSIRDAEGRPRIEFDDGEPFVLLLEYECAQPIQQPVFRIVFSLPDERRVAVVGWHPGDSRSVQPGRGVLRFQVHGGTLFARRYVLHTSISAWDGVVYDTHYGVCELKIHPRERGPILRNTDDLAAYLKYTVEHSVP